MDAPVEVTNAMYAGMRDLIQELVDHPLPGVWEAKLKGWPWRSIDAESVMNARRLLLRLFAILESYGFTVYASIDQKADLDSEKSETDTWHCCRPLDWELLNIVEAGAPVYHAWISASRSIPAIIDTSKMSGIIDFDKFMIVFL